MCRSFKQTPLYVYHNQIAHPKSKTFWMYGHWIDLSDKNSIIQKELKRKIYSNKDELKKHGKFLVVKEGKSQLWVCPKHNTARYLHCDHAEKYDKNKSACKSNIKYQLTRINVDESYDEESYDEE